MSTDAIISPAFRPFLEESGPNDKREAIVIYRSPVDPRPPVHGRLKKLRQKLDAIKRIADEHKPVEKRLLLSYTRAVGKEMKPADKSKPHTIGSNELPVTAVEVTRNTLPELAKQPDVLAILPNQVVHLLKPKQIKYETLAKNEAKHGVPWGLQYLDIPEMWKKTKGADINVAVLDTGAHGDHPAIKPQIKDFVVIDPLGRRITASPAFDGSTHGTHVCGTIAGGKDPDNVSIGVAPEANLFVAAVLVGDSTLQTLLEGMAWAVEKGADIINMSLGFTYYEPLFNIVLQMLTEQYGILPVVAIGNENHGNTSSPGNSPSAFSVGALERMPSNKVDVPFFSSGASLVFPGETPDMVSKPDVVAPGVQIWSCVPPQKQPTGTYMYTYMDGTSMATPHVAGVAALLMAAKPDAPVADIMKVLRDTAKHPTGNRPDNRWGYGAIRPLDALKTLTS